MPFAQLTVRVHTRAGRDEIAGERDGVLQVRVTAPPVDGRANRAVCRLLAKRAGLAPSRVSVVRGERSRDKVVRFDGIDTPTLRATLGAGDG